MNRIALDLGIIQIYWYSICIFLGVLIGSTYIFKEAKRKRLNTDFVTNLMFYSIIFGFVGARLYYCLFSFEYYSKYPLEILEIWNGGLAIHGGLLFGGLFVLFYTLKYKLKTLQITDIVAPGVLLGQGVGRWGNFFNQEAFGQEVTREVLEKTGIPDFIINGMNINGTYYQPTFLYESIWNIFGFIAILILKKYKNLKNGQICSFYLIWYSFGRFFIESLRSDSLMLGNFKVAQIVSIVLFILGIILFIICGLGPKFKNSYHEEVKQINF